MATSHSGWGNCPAHKKNQLAMYPGVWCILTSVFSVIVRSMTNICSNLLQSSKSTRSYICSVDLVRLQSCNKVECAYTKYYNIGQVE